MIECRTSEPKSQQQEHSSDFQYDESFESDIESFTDAIEATSSRETDSLGTLETTSETPQKDFLSSFIKRLVENVKQNTSFRPVKNNKREEQSDNPELTAFISKSIAVLQKEDAESNNKDRLEERKGREDDCISKGFPWKIQIERMKAENLTRHLEKIARNSETPEEPSEKHSWIKTKEFIRRKIKIIEDKELSEKYVRHITEKTSAMMVADMIRSSINPLATPDEIWMEFLKPLHSFNRRDPREAKPPT